MLEQKNDQAAVGFDLRTHIKDPKTGEITKVNHYAMEISKANGVRFERPIGSGNFYAPNGVLLVKGKDPVTEKSLAQELAETKAQLAQFQSEFDAKQKELVANSNKAAANSELQAQASEITESAPDSAKAAQVQPGAQQSKK